MSDLVGQLRELMDTRGVAQRVLADAIGLTEVQLSKVMRGRRELKASEWERAQAFFSARGQSNDATERAAALLSAHRDSIDRLDAILVFTLAERFKHTQCVGRLKAEHDLPPSDPAREAEQIARLERLAAEADLDPEFARKFLTFIISEVIRHHESHLENGPQSAQGLPPQTQGV